MAIGLILTALFIFAACSFPAGYAETPDVYSSVRVYPVPDHGAVTLSGSRVQKRTDVQIYVNPDPGYVLTWENISADLSTPIAVGEPAGAYFEIGVNSNVVVNVKFVHKSELPAEAANYTVSVNRSISHGVVYADRRIAPGGTLISLVLVPDTGYDLAAGSFKVMSPDGAVLPVSVSGTLPYQFTLPNSDVLVDVQFEEKDISGLVASGRKYLNAGQYDTAASFYREAWKKGTGGAGADVNEAVFFSSLADLCALLTDDKDIRSFITPIFPTIPQTLDDLLRSADSFVENDPKEWYIKWEGDPRLGEEDSYLPKVNTGFGSAAFAGNYSDFPVAQGSNANTRQKFNNLLFWALLYNYRENGFNDLLYRINRYGFGDKFEAIAKRAADLSEDARIELPQPLRTRFNLDKYYGTGPVIYVGKPELDFIFAKLRVYKAAAEFLYAYDWTIYLQPFLVNNIDPTDDLISLLDKVFTLNLTSSEVRFKEVWDNPANLGRILPLRNKFLRTRDASYLVKAKDDLSGALEMAHKSMSFWWGSSGQTARFSNDGQNHYGWARAGIRAARDAVTSDANTVFYYPERTPRSDEYISTWPTRTMASYPANQIWSRNRIYGVDLAQLFIPGKFTLTNLVTTEMNDRTPSMFKVEWYEDRSNGYAPGYTGNYDRVTAPIPSEEHSVAVSNVANTGNRAPTEMYAFQIKTDELRTIFPRGFEQSNYFDKTGNSAWHHEVFPEIPLWPGKAIFLKGNIKGAWNLYKYYHL
jgi:hypothetical protein